MKGIYEISPEFKFLDLWESVQTNQILHFILMWEVLLCFSSRQIHNQVKIRNIGISEEFMIKFTYNQGKIWNIEMISGDAFLKSSEEEAGFVATQSVVLCSFDFIRVATVTIFNPIQDGLFWGCSRMGGGCKKTPPCLKSVTHILQWWNLA